MACVEESNVDTDIERQNQSSQGGAGVGSHQFAMGNWNSRTV